MSTYKVLVIFAALFVLIISNDAFSQGYTPPTVTLGASFDGSFAIHDAYGTDFSKGNNGNTYGLMWGRGGSLYAKIGLGMRKNHRIVIGGTYAKFINSGVLFP